jgi:phosphoribosylglycinamide formyltransferase-1
VPVFEDDTEETLSERILKQEHKIFPMAIKLFSEDKITVGGRNVIINGNREDTVIANPSLV